jgi:hypothetical protein
MRRPRRPTVALLAASAALALAGCGNKEPDGVLTGETEGIYVTLDDVKYQVQLSRILNPRNVEDSAYLRGVLPGEAELEDGETWFGVWLRAENESEEPKPKADEFEIVDTLGEQHEPVQQPNNILSWAEQPETIRAAGVLPVVGSIAEEGTIQGSLLLFKLSYATLENRPLELEIHSPAAADRIGKINLDV